MMFSPKTDEWWLNTFNRVYLWSGGIAALFGVIAIFATRGIQVYSNRVDASQKKHIADMELQTADVTKQTADAHQKIADAQARMEDARASAAVALEGQQRLSAEAEKARLEQKSLELQVAKSGVQQAELKKQNLQLQSQVEEQKMETLRLQERFAPRHLSTVQSQKLTAALRRLPPSRIDIYVHIGTDDGIPLSREFMNSINAAGWQAEHLGQHAGGGLIRGLAILLDHEGQLTGQELLFYDALLAARGISRVFPRHVTA